MNYTDFFHDPRITTLKASSRTEDVIAAVGLARTLPHWLDRARAVELVSGRTSIASDHLNRIMGEAWKR